MSYHKFSNFGEKLNSDLNTIVNAGTVCVKNGAREATVTAPTEAAADSRWLFTIYTANAVGKTT